MRRRNFIVSTGVAAFWPFLATAQLQRRATPRIGVLLPGPPETYVGPIANFRRGLAERGYREPQTVELDLRYSGAEPALLPVLAQQLVSGGVDVVVTSATPGVRAAMAATSTVPIVIAAAADVVGAGLVASLARPGGNVTGLTLLIPDLAAKQLQLIKEFVPMLARVGILRGRAEGAQAPETIRAAGITLKIEVHFEEIDSAMEIPSAFDRIAKAQCQALLLVDGPTLNPARELVATLALKYRLPAISTLRLFVEAGSLVAYGPNVGMMWHRAAYYVDRILRGEKPGDLPIEQPNAFELVINRKTAKYLGLEVPNSLMVRADEIIES